MTYSAIRSGLVSFKLFKVFYFVLACTALINIFEVSKYPTLSDLPTFTISIVQNLNIFFNSENLIENQFTMAIKIILSLILSTIRKVSETKLHNSLSERILSKEVPPSWVAPSLQQLVGVAVTTTIMCMLATLIKTINK